MTHAVVEQVRLMLGSSVSPEVEVEVRGATASFGSEVIATPQSFAVGAEAAFEAWRQHEGWPDAILLACFGDPGLAALRAAARVPVAGMAESAMREAAALARPYRIVTAGAQWPAMLRETARCVQAGRWLEEVAALPATGLAVSRDPEAFMPVLRQALDDAEAAGVRTVLLGGAGFAGLRGRLRFEGVLIDGLEAAVRQIAIHSAIHISIHK